MIENIISSMADGIDENAKECLLQRAKQLVKRGIKDEATATEFALNEYKNGVVVPKKLKIELYDKVNYMCRCYMDRIARFSLSYDFVPDIDALKTVLVCLFEKAPIMHSRVVDNHILPYWRVCDYTIDDALEISESDDLEKSAYDFLVKSIPITDNAQMKIALFIKDGKSILCFRWNHMIMDGGGFKQFVCDICSNYNEYVKTKTVPLDFRVGTRDYKAVYADMTPEMKKGAKKQIAGLSAKEKHTLPFTKKAKDDRNIIIKKEVCADAFTKARLIGKKYGATANDVLVAAYIRAYHRISGIDKNQKISISCAVDLRRYIKDTSAIGYTNHTTFMPAFAESFGENFEDTIRMVSESTKKAKQDKYMGLHGLPLLDVGFSAAAYFWAETVVKTFYTNANLAVSNVGPINLQAFSLDSNEPTNAFVAGGAKVKPCAAITALSIRDKLCFAMTIQGNDRDKTMVEKFFDLIEDEFMSL